MEPFLMICKNNILQVNLFEMNTMDKLINVTGFGKTCIVHTSDFAHLEIHKNHREWYTDLTLSGIIQE